MTAPLIGRMMIVFGIVSGALTVAVSEASAQQSVSVDRAIVAAYARVVGLTPTAFDIASLRAKSVDESGHLDEDHLFVALFDVPEFVDNRLATFVSKMSNEGAEPFENADDFQISFAINIQRGHDVRNLLSKPFYVSNVSDIHLPLSVSSGFYQVGVVELSMAALIAKLDLQYFKTATGMAPLQGYYSEGLVSTQGFGKRFIKAGTNRRSVRAAFDLFLCSKLESWKDGTLDPSYIGRDVDRAPGADPKTFRDACQSCHAPLDAMRGALAKWDYLDRDSVPAHPRYTRLADVVDKYNQNEQVYPDGFVTYDDSWENLLTTPAHQKRFGWRGPTSGRGALEFTTMIANSHQFQSCMVQRTLAVFCDADAARVRVAMARPAFQVVTERFRDQGYQIKSLIKDIVRSGLCK